MIGKLIRSHLRGWLILIVVYSAILFLTYVTVSSQISYSVNENSLTYFYNTRGNALLYVPILYPVIISLLASCVFPILVFSYRFDLSRADTYLSLPIRKGAFRVTRILVGLFAILIPYTVVYWLGFGIQTLIYATQAIPSGYVRIPMYFAWYVPMYFASFLGIACVYLVNCFFASQGTNVWSSLISVIAGQFALGLSLFLFGLTVLAYCSVTSGVSSNFSQTVVDLLYLNPSAVGVGILSGGVFAELAWSGNATLSTLETIFLSIGMGTLLVGGGLSFLYLSKKNDPSGEYAGKSGPITIGNTVPFHVAAFSVLLLSVTGIGSVSRYLMPITVLQLSVSAAAYFFLRALLRKKLAPSKVDLITMISVVSVCLVWAIVFAAQNLR